MITKASCPTLLGISPIPVVAECSTTNGLPYTVIVGLGNRLVDESKERLRSGFANSRLPYPKKRITINLAPADMPKVSTAYDVAMAAAILMQSVAPHPDIAEAAFVGEVGLDGAIRATRATASTLLACQKLGIKRCVLPASQAALSFLTKGVTSVFVKNLGELECIIRTGIPSSRLGAAVPRPADAHPTTASWDSITGADFAKRAAIIAAAGRHNLLLFGPPGVGKSLIASAAADLLPPLSPSASAEVTILHNQKDEQYLFPIAKAPMRTPHHTASITALLGSTQSGLPGELALSHHGVLVLDELPEFAKATLEALRQPIESKRIRLSHGKYSTEYPADGIVVATANPCPCGYADSERPCSCTPYQVQRYRAKLSGPLLDRFSLFVHMPLGEGQKQSGSTLSLSAARHMVQRARAALAPSISRDAEALLEVATDKLRLSSRAKAHTLAVASTIARLANQTDILECHVAEALQYRQPSIFSH